MVSTKKKIATPDEEKEGICFLVKGMRVKANSHDEAYAAVKKSNPELFQSDKAKEDDDNGEEKDEE